MYHTDVFSLSGCRSVVCHPKAILSGIRIIGGHRGRHQYPDILSTEFLHGQPEGLWTFSSRQHASATGKCGCS